MSFAEKIAVLMARPGQDVVPKDDVPWWMKYSGRGLGTVGGAFAILFGVYNCLGIITAQVGCLVGGLWQMVAGFLVVVCEAPCCCMFVDFVQQLSDWFDRRPYWNKAAVYIVMSIPPFILCFGLATLFGSGLIFATGIIYGMMSLGKKASAEEMRSSAINLEAGPGGGQSSSGMRSNLVTNQSPVSFTGPPVIEK